MNHTALLTFIIAAKTATYVGNGAKSDSSRKDSHDLVFEQGDWDYRDSYFGGTNFVGQEVVWFKGAAVWAMNYYGYILRADLIDATKAGETLKAALALPQSQGRLLDNLSYAGPHGHYTISSRGDVTHFSGREEISVNQLTAYALDFHGGHTKP